MNFLINHWHCILPVIAILAALFLQRKNGEGFSEREKAGKEEER